MRSIRSMAARGPPAPELIPAIAADRPILVAIAVVTALGTSWTIAPTPAEFSPPPAVHQWILKVSRSSPLGLIGRPPDRIAARIRDDNSSAWPREG